MTRKGIIAILYILVTFLTITQTMIMVIPTHLPAVPVHLEQLAHPEKHGLNHIDPDIIYVLKEYNDAT